MRRRRRLILSLCAFAPVTLSAALAAGQAHEPTDTLRGGFSGFVHAGLAFWRINGNGMAAPEVSVGLGAQWRRLGLYGVFSVATGAIAPEVRVWLFSTGLQVEGRYGRWRFGAGPRLFLWQYDQVTVADAVFRTPGIAVRADLNVDIARLSVGALSLGGHISAGLFGDELPGASSGGHIGFRW